MTHNESLLEYKKTIFLFRHGARAPSKPALDFFIQNPLVKKDWTHPDGSLHYDELTSFGKKDCGTLGQYVRKHITDNFNVTFNTPDQIKWRSSSVSRAVESGELFLNGFFGNDSVQLKVELQPYNVVPGITPKPEKTFADYYIRPWDVHTEFKQWEATLRSSEPFIVKANENSELLSSFISQLNLKGLDKFPKSVLLYGMTFARELVDCERYFPDLTTKAFQTQLASEQIDKISDLALWCWDRRFFKTEFKKQLPALLSNELEQEILHAGEPGQSLFSVYSGHDYTILVLLAAWGVENYAEVLSFCAYLLIDVFERKNGDGTTSKVFTITLNSTPLEVKGHYDNIVHAENEQPILTKQGDRYWTQLSA